MPRKKAVPEEEPQIIVTEYPAEETPPLEAPAAEIPHTEETAPAMSERQQFFALDFNALDRELTEDERNEWNTIYASYRGRSALSGKIIGVDLYSNHLGGGEWQNMYCAIVIPYRVRIVIPATEMWSEDHTPPTYVLHGMVGAKIDFVITRVEREAGFAMASRKEAMRSQRYYFSHRGALNIIGTKLKCNVLSVGPRCCTIECYGHDISITQRDLSYTSIADLREVYHPGDELDCVVKSYDAESDRLVISIKETKSNPYDGAIFRHPIGSRRQAVISGKYGGGVFCNLPDGTVCLCNYSYQYADSDFKTGDTVVLLVHRYDDEKKQM